MKGHKEQLEIDDARMIIRLLGNTIAQDGGHGEKKAFLMEGLCELVGADAWVWTLGLDLRKGGTQTVVGFAHGGFDESRLVRYLEALESKEAAEVAWNFYGKLLNQKISSHLTMTRQEIDPRDRASFGAAGEVWKAADIGPVLMSGRLLDTQSTSLIGVYRRLGEKAFSQKEKLIVDLVLTEVSWLHEAGWAENQRVSLPSLTPRQRMTLNLLLDGWGRKQMAYEWSISENTVAGYIREVYRHFGVHSREELMKKFLGGSPQVGG